MRRFQILISVLISTIAISGCSRPSDRFQRADAEKAGFSLSSLDELGSFLEYSGSSALLVLQDGKVVYEWGDIYKKHTIHSIRKCLLNGLMGIYVERGLIDTNLTLSQLDIDDTNHKLTYGEKLARMADLLRSRSGVYHDAAAETASMLKNRPLKGLHEPNEAFYYNNWDFNTLGYIFEQAAGKSIFKAFYEEFAIPLGMLQYQGETSSIDEDDPDAHIPKTDGYYQYERSRSSYPAYQFRMSAHDLALYGLLFQRDGNWQGKQLISSDWISASTYPYSPINPDKGISYGMLWYVLSDGEDGRPGGFFHTGAGVHMLAVYPALKMVVVHRVDTENEDNFIPQSLHRIMDRVLKSYIGT